MGGVEAEICIIIMLLMYFVLGGARLPLGMFNPGRRKTPSPTPPLRRLAPLPILVFDQLLCRYMI
jgi:hypothetical protein